VGTPWERIGHGNAWNTLGAYPSSSRFLPLDDDSPFTQHIPTYIPHVCVFRTHVHTHIGKVRKMAWGGSARRRSGGGRGRGWGLCVAAVAGCGAAGRFRRLGFGVLPPPLPPPFSVSSARSSSARAMTARKAAAPELLRDISLWEISSSFMSASTYTHTHTYIHTYIHTYY